MSLIVKTRVEDGIVILDLHGRLWILDLPLREKMDELLAQGHVHFVLSLPGVGYIDSSGLGQLVSIWTSIKNRGGHLYLVRPSKRVQHLFAITRLDTVFQIFQAESDTLAYARKQITTPAKAGESVNEITGDRSTGC